MSPTFFTSCNSLPPEVANACLGLALRSPI